MGWSRSAQRFRASLVLVGVVAMVFYPACFGEFLSWDDVTTIARHPNFNPPRWASLWAYWSHPYFDLYIPVTYSWMLLAAVFARSNEPSSTGIFLDPGVFHAANIILHGINVLLVYGILRDLVRNNNAALVGALLFAVHPLQVESVAWISGAKDLLCATFCLLTIGHYLKFAMDRETSRGRRHLTWAVFGFVLALLSKPSAVALPLALGAIEVGLLRHPIKFVVRPMGVFCLLSAPVAILARVVQQAKPVDFIPSLGCRPFIAMDALAFYMVKLIAPVDLTPDVGRSPPWLLTHEIVYFSWMLPAVWFALAWLMRRRFPAFWVVSIVSLAALLPVLGLVPFDFQLYSTVADHYVYLAMLGPAIGLAFVFAVARPVMSRRIVGVLAILMLFIFGMVSRARTRDWIDTRALFSKAMLVNPSSRAAGVNLAMDAHGRGDDANAERLLRRTLQYHPDDINALFDLANILAAHDESGKAKVFYHAALLRDPNRFDIWTNLALTLLREWDLDQAISAANRAVTIEPTSAQGRANLARILFVAGHRAEAIEQYQRALRIDPTLMPAILGLEEAIQRQFEPPLH